MKNYDFDKLSLAVVAMGENGRGALLYGVGGHIKAETEEAGLHDLSDLGLDDAEPGVWVWEGLYVWFSGGFENPTEGWSDPKGSWRRPSPEEWAAILDGRCPWNDDDWVLR